MKNPMNNPIFNDVLTGLLIAATFALAVPGDAMADLLNATNQAQDTVAAPALKLVSYVSYVFGGYLVVSGIAHAKKHADAPANNPLGPAVGKLGAGAAMLAAPAVVGMLQQTGNTTTGGSNGTFMSISGT